MTLFMVLLGMIVVISLGVVTAVCWAVVVVFVITDLWEGHEPKPDWIAYTLIAVCPFVLAVLASAFDVLNRVGHHAGVL